MTFEKALVDIITKYVCIDRKEVREALSSFELEAFYETLKSKKLRRRKSAPVNLKGLCLDVGCGRKNNGFNVIGVDIHNINVPFEMVRTDSLCFRQCFDIVTANMSLHHMENKERKLKEMCSLIVKGGTLIIRDHDGIKNKEWLNFMKEVHTFFDRVVDRNDTLLCNYCGYCTKDFVITTVTSFGFKLVKATKPKGSMRVYKATFVNE